MSVSWASVCALDVRRTQTALRAIDACRSGGCHMSSAAPTVHAGGRRQAIERNTLGAFMNPGKGDTHSALSRCEKRSYIFLKLR